MGTHYGNDQSLFDYGPDCRDANEFLLERNGRILCWPLDALPLAVPSFLYVVQDNLIVYALSCVDATTYQVTYQTKILTTAFFAGILLNQILTIKRWLSLLLLMLGVILTQVNFHQEKGNWSLRSENKDASTWNQIKELKDKYKYTRSSRSSTTNTSPS